MTPNPLASAVGHTDSVTALSLSDNLLASGGEDGNTYLWSLDQSQFPVLCAPRLDHCSSLKFSAARSHILYSAYGQQIVSWDIRRMTEPVVTWEVNDDEINSIDFSGDEHRLSSADDSGAVQIIDVNNGQVTRTLKKHDNICSSAKFRPGRTWQLISGGLDCRVIVSDWKGSGLGVIIFEMDEIVESPEEFLQSLPTDSDWRHGSSTSSNDNVEIDYDNSDDTDFGATYAAGHSQIIADKEIFSFINDDTLIESASLSKGWTSSQIIISVEPDKNEQPHVSNQRMSSNHVTWRSGLPINPPMVHSVACSASGDFVAAGLESSTIELFAGDGKRLNHLESLYGHTRGVSALHFIDDFN
ncbi:putative wd40 protein [Schistosoma mansoni]|uniref:putative wd40 protein n=1 Tax=Schistosoma mansoni TaxID=6183 RepID=UPI00022DC9EB|nr:putative wd40 protein [Schistosoma mansoni]|eukprot:XP_018654876.1 putative wd40 protein [Schistosoma mansoni]